jgi:hypothetical protein
VKLLVIAMIGLSLCGCSGEQLARAQASLQAAETRLAMLSEAVESTGKALEAAKRIADATGSEAAIAAVQTAQDMRDTLATALPAARDAAAMARAAVESAEMAQRNRFGWVEMLVTAGITLATGGGAAIAQAVKARKWAQVAAHGLRLANEIKHRAEAVDLPIQPILDRAVAWQEAKGVRADVDAVRRG